MSQIQDNPTTTTPTIQNILLTHRKMTNTSAVLLGKELEDTRESIELLKLEKKLNRSLLAILKYMVKNEIENTVKPRLPDLKRKYGFLFSTVFRANIEEIYRLGGAYGTKFDELPTLTYFTTDRDLALIRQYTSSYSRRIWGRIEKFLLSRDPARPPIGVEFIVDTLAAEIATFVMMEATKEKTRQVLQVLDKNNPNSQTVAETAALQPVLGYGPESLSALLAIKGYSELKENSDFTTIFDTLDDEAFFSNIMTDRYVFIWMTARDDKVCKKYCRPLDGVIWTMKEINLIPLPDQLTHAFCRCRLLKLRI
ncbi:MAG: hypothetical protein L0H53_03830 [Candidatus Nitrosocosmicus sp.]|nr:hypothetical protein [Candidatus Nitrosocosmicus sp.]MDN5866244.1 hypothetical protein [Candidatus Nitrosocosmicus sp.]